MTRLLHIPLETGGVLTVDVFDAYNADHAIVVEIQGPVAAKGRLTSDGARTAAKGFNLAADVFDATDDAADAALSPVTQDLREKYYAKPSNR